MSKYEEQVGPDGDVRVAMIFGFTYLGTVAGAVASAIFVSGWAAAGVVCLGIAAAVALYRNTEERDGDDKIR